MPTIHSLQDPDDDNLTDYRDLTDVALRSRREPEWGIYIAESLKVLERALMAGHRPLSVLTTSQWLPRVEHLCETYPTMTEDMPVYVGSEAILEGITGFHVHRGTLASIARPALPPVSELLRGQRRIVVLENIVDHTNVGAIFRSVAGIGADGIIVSESCADPLYRRSVRVSMGTVMQVPWTRAGSWSELMADVRRAGYEVAALALGPQATRLDDFAQDPPPQLVLLLGTEGDGLSAEALASADHLVSIPMKGSVDSLNVAAASAVALWALR